MSILSDINALPKDELVDLKNKIIDDIDKKRYSKEVLSSMSRADAIATVNWIKKRYEI